MEPATLAAILLVFGPQPSGFQMYSVDMAFEGFIPILGGQEGKAELHLGLKVSNEPPKNGHLVVSTELTEAKLLWNGAELPIEFSDFKDFLPKSTTELFPNGKFVSTTAPIKDIPFKLPGLDATRMAELSAFPIEFPTKEIATREQWTFVRVLGGSEITTTAMLGVVTDSTATVSFTTSQKYEVMENAAVEVVTDPADAENKVSTISTGTGKMQFNREHSVLDYYELKAQTTSTVTPITGGETSTRKMSSFWRIQRKLTGGVKPPR